MKTDYQKINSFEAAVVTMITIGFVLIGAILFAGLTPRGQVDVALSFKMFDIHEQAASQVNSTIEGIEFAMDIPIQFYSQFYVAFTQIAALPPETFEFPATVASELGRNISVAINNLTDQVVVGYAQQIQTQVAIAQVTQQATEAYGGHAGIVLGAMLDSAASTLPANTGIEIEPQVMPTLNISTGYNPPDLNNLKSSLINLLKK